MIFDISTALKPTHLPGPAVSPRPEDETDAQTLANTPASSPGRFPWPSHRRWHFCTRVSHARLPGPARRRASRLAAHSVMPNFISKKVSMLSRTRCAVERIERRSKASRRRPGRLTSDLTRAGHVPRPGGRNSTHTRGAKYSCTRAPGLIR